MGKEQKGEGSKSKQINKYFLLIKKKNTIIVLAKMFAFLSAPPGCFLFRVPLSYHIFD